MNPAMFREYDIRGLAENDFDKEFALLLGKVHGTPIAETGGTRVTVGAIAGRLPMLMPKR